MKQLIFGFLREQMAKLPIRLDEEVQQELLKWMAEAIVVVFQRGGITEDEKRSVQQ